MRWSVTATDRTFRALAREQPSIVLSLLGVVGLGSVADGVTPRPDEVGDPQVDRPAAALEADSVIFLGNTVWHTELQGYRDASFEDRLFRYHVHLIVRHWPRPVQSLAVWLRAPSERIHRRRISRGSVTVHFTSLVVPETSASRMLAIPGAACFSAGARAGRWSERTLCDRVVMALREQGASARVQQMAILAAHSHGIPRYTALREAMRRAKMPEIILEDFVKIGEDIGEKRGLQKGLEQGLEQGLEKGLAPLTHQFSRRLARPLTTIEAQRLAARLDTLGPDRIGDVILDLDATALAQWLADPLAI